jgi:hypothetical protein
LLNISLIVFVTYILKKVSKMRGEFVNQLQAFKVVLHYFNDFVEFTQNIGFDSYQIATSPVLTEIINRISIIRALIAKISGKTEIDVVSIIPNQNFESEVKNV